MNELLSNEMNSITGVGGHVQWSMNAMELLTCNCALCPPMVVPPHESKSM